MIDRTETILGTRIRIAVHPDTPHLLELVGAAFSETRRIEAAYSRFIEGNELARLNHSAGEWTRVSDELLLLLRWGKFFESATGGAFSLGIKPILEWWGYDAEYRLDREILDTQLGSYEISEDARIRVTGSIEIGAIGKWYALDRMAHCLNACENIFINAGGDVYARGYTPDGRPWRALLGHPTDTRRAIGETVLDGYFLAGSSPLVRQWRDRHHLVDAQTLAPASDMTAVWVLAEAGIVADGWSTACFVSGYDHAKMLAETHDLSVLLIARDGDIYRRKFPAAFFGVDG